MKAAASTLVIMQIPVSTVLLHHADEYDYQYFDLSM
ncbi:hypothetical protein SAMN04489725_103149 [Alicyclobacillus hesperidum]|uniref:Uncharacterized protein n=1 Tax=Alicyclobacillus hesperidum TaxID=89784 RepID=A0A1H2RU91_9BACL|nr:hypothetical protein SAMN04489725_103149 [Alicyclobacillus hesperidum]